MKAFRLCFLLALPLVLFSGCGDEQDSRLTDADVLCIKMQTMGGSCTGSATGTSTNTSTVTVTTSTVSTDTSTVTVTSTGTY